MKNEKILDIDYLDDGSRGRSFHRYECDGKMLDDRCSYARITSGGTLIKECLSGNEYVCQSVVEMP